MKKIILPFVLSWMIQYHHVQASVITSGALSSIGDLLLPNGSLDLTTGFSGSLNIEGFEVVIDECQGLIVRPQPADECNAEMLLSGTWDALGSGLDGNCLAIAVLGTDVYVGGEFTTAGGISANRIAKWDGTSWSALGSGLNHWCEALAVLGSELYVGGQFTTAGGISANRIAKWDGINWSTVGSGLNNYCLALAISGSDVFAGGRFTTAGGISANYIAKWDGTNWSALGTGLNSFSFALAASGSDVYVGGQFSTAGGISANRIAKWDGTNWSSLGVGLDNICHALAVDGSNLYAGGEFFNAGGNSAFRIAKWDGTTWSTLGAGLGGQCRTIQVSGSDIYAGGNFTTAGGIPANKIAKWDGSTWSEMDGGLNDRCSAIAILGNDLYAGGRFTTAGAVSASRVAQYSILPLPIELIYFRGHAENQKVSLDWSTATEINNKGFEIQRAVGPELERGDWTTIGFVEGNGNSFETIYYSFVDHSPVSAVNYYRLKQIDYDGVFEYSKIVHVEVKNIQDLSVIPNPVSNGSFQLSLAREDFEHVQLYFFDKLGRMVRHIQLAENEMNIDTEGLVKGTYSLVVDMDGQFITKNIIIQ